MPAPDAVALERAGARGGAPAPIAHLSPPACVPQAVLALAEQLAGLRAAPGLRDLPDPAVKLVLACLGPRGGAALRATCPALRAAVDRSHAGRVVAGYAPGCVRPAQLADRFPLTSAVLLQLRGPPSTAELHGPGERRDEINLSLGHAAPCTPPARARRAGARRRMPAASPDMQPGVGMGSAGGAQASDAARLLADMAALPAAAWHRVACVHGAPLSAALARMLVRAAPQLRQLTLAPYAPALHAGGAQAHDADARSALYAVVGSATELTRLVLGELPPPPPRQLPPPTGVSLLPQGMDAPLLAGLWAAGRRLLSLSVLASSQDMDLLASALPHLTVMTHLAAAVSGGVVCPGCAAAEALTQAVKMCTRGVHAIMHGAQMGAVRDMCMDRVLRQAIDACNTLAHPCSRELHACKGCACAQHHASPLAPPTPPAQLCVERPPSSWPTVLPTLGPHASPCDEKRWITLL